MLGASILKPIHPLDIEGRIDTLFIWMRWHCASLILLYNMHTLVSVILGRIILKISLSDVLVENHLGFLILVLAMKRYLTLGTAILKPEEHVSSQFVIIFA